jgi:hypothetical protein
MMLADYLRPDTQQKLSVGAGAWFFSQQRGAGPCQPTRTKVHATQLALASQAPWQFSGEPFAGKLKLVISEPARSFPYSTVWAQAGVANRAMRAKVDATMRCFITGILHFDRNLRTQPKVTITINTQLSEQARDATINRA